MTGSTARISTAALCMLIAGFAAWRSVPVLGLALAELGSTRSQSEGALAGLVPSSEPVALTDASLQTAMPFDAAQLSPADRVLAAGRLLAHQPLSSRAWLELATARLAAGEGMEAVVQALRLCALTGPNESVLMAGRVLFALPLWAALPDDLHRRIARDIAGGWDRLETSDKLVLRLTLSSTPSLRAELAAMLHQVDGMNEARLDELGLLNPAPSAQPQGSPP